MQMSMNRKRCSVADIRRPLIRREVEIGDLVIVATDGVLDNLYADDIQQVLANHSRRYEFSLGLRLGLVWAI
jgi:hypothetical protein